jgi:hypothetical protein
MKTADWKKPQPVPTGKFSANVRPFKFGDALHREIFGRLNRRGNGRNARLKTHCNSTGVVWNGLPFYWSTKGHYRGGAIGQRKPLHWQVWEQASGKSVPIQPRHVVVFLDGNKHNFSPANLALRTRAQIGAQNQRLTSEQKRELMLAHWAKVPAAERARRQMTDWTRRSRRLVASLLNTKQPLTNLRRKK